MERNCEFTEIIEDGRVVAIRDLETGRVIPIVAGGEGDDDADPDKDADKGSDKDAGDEDGEGAEKAAKEAAGAGDDDDAKDDDTDKHDAGDTGDKGQVGLKKRLSKVSARLKSYRDHGSPEEFAALKAEVAKYKKYEAEIEQEEKARVDEENRKKGLPSIEQQNAQLDRILERRFGEGASEDFAEFRNTRQMELSRHVKEGHAFLRSLMEKHGLEGSTTGEAFDEWDRHIGAALRKSPERMAQFRNPITSNDAIEVAFKEVKRFLVDPAVAVSSAGKIKALAERRAAAPSSSGRPTAPRVDVGELKPPDKLKGRARSDWWDRKLEEVGRELDDQPDTD